MTDGFDIREYIIEANDKVVTEAIQDDFQYERQKLLIVLRDLTYSVDNARSPHEAGAAGHEPKKEKAAIAGVREFKTKVNHLGMDWKALVRTF